MSNRPVLEEDSGPLYLRAVMGLDKTWARSAACVGVPEAARRYWDAEPEGFGAKPTEARIARAFCRGCPVQWDCVTYAIESKSEFCTWAVHAPDRRLLAKRNGKDGRSSWQELVEKARVDQVPVQDLMLTLRPRKRYE